MTSKIVGNIFCNDKYSSTTPLTMNNGGGYGKPVTYYGAHSRLELVGFRPFISISSSVVVKGTGSSSDPFVVTN